MNGNYEYDADGADDAAVPSEAEFMRLMAQLLGLDDVEVGVDTSSRRETLERGIRDYDHLSEGEGLGWPLDQLTADLIIGSRLWGDDDMTDDEALAFLLAMADCDGIWALANAEKAACQLHSLLHRPNGGKFQSVSVPPVRVDEFPVPASLVGLVCDDPDVMAEFDGYGLPDGILRAVGVFASVGQLPDDQQAVDLLQYLADTRLVWRVAGGGGHQLAHKVGQWGDSPFGADRVRAMINVRPLSIAAEYKLNLEAMLSALD